MFNIRNVTSADLEIICRHRHLMFEEADNTRAGLAAAYDPFKQWLQDKLKTNSYSGYIAEIEDEPIGGIGVMALDWPPHPLHPTNGQRGYILNLYVEQQFRGQGVAKSLMQAAEQALRDRGITYAILHPTNMARPIYEKMNWSRTSEMSKSF